MQAAFIFILCVAVLILFLQLSELRRRFMLLERMFIEQARQGLGEEDRKIDQGTIDQGSRIQTEEEETHEVSHSVSHSVSHEVSHSVSHSVSHEVPLRSSGESLEVLFGGKLLNRLGALATLIGLVFLFKWGVDNGWITETVRVIVGLVVGAAAIAVGPRLERKGLTVFAQGVIATGIATCYLSVYASFTYYHLVPVFVAYVGMAVLAAMAIWRSLAHASLFLAMMSGLVGFSAPMVLQTGVMNTGGLFTYLGFIAVMMLATVYGLRKWFSLYFVALGATLLWWIVWNIGGYRTDGYQQPAAAFSIIADILLFAGALVAIRWRALEIFDRAKVISTMIVLWLLCLVVNSTTFDYALWSDVGVALVPVLIVSAAWLMVRRGEPRSALAHGLGILVIAVACLVPWTCSYDNNLQDLTLIVIAALGTILGARMQYSGMRLAADIIMGLQLLSIVTPSYVLDLPPEVMVVLNTTMLHYVLIALYMWFLMEQRPSLRQLAPAVLTYALTLQAQLALQNAQYPWWIQVMMPISLWTLMQGITVMLTRRRDLAYADMYATVGMAIGVLSWLSMGLQWPTSADHTGLFNMRVVSGISIVAMQLLLWFTMPRPTGRFNDAMVIWPSIMLITFLLTTMETITPQWKIITEASDVHGWESMVVRDLMDRMQLLLSCAWIVYAAIVVAIGFVKRVKVARLTGMGVLGVAVLKVFLYDLSNLQTPFRIISFIVLGLILFGASYLYARFKDRINA